MDTPDDIRRIFGGSEGYVLAVNVDDLAGIAVMQGLCTAGTEINSSLTTLEKICNICASKPDIAETFGLDLDVLQRQVMSMYRVLLNVVTKAILPLESGDVPEHLERMRRTTMGMGDEIAADLRERRDAFAERHNL